MFYYGWNKMYWFCYQIRKINMEFCKGIFCKFKYCLKQLEVNIYICMYKCVLNNDVLVEQLCIEIFQFFVVIGM